MKTSNEVKQITEALINFQSDCPTLKKDKEGYGYKYVTLDNIISVTKPILLKYKMVIIQSVGESANGVMITTRLQHISGEYFEDSFSLAGTQMKNVNNIQAMGASITYGKRYGQGAIMNLCIDEDTDAVTTQKPQQQNQTIVNPLDIQIMQLVKQYGIAKGCENYKSYNDTQKLDMINYYKGKINEQSK